MMADIIQGFAEIDSKLRAAMDAQTFRDEADWAQAPDRFGSYSFCPIRFMAYLERFGNAENCAAPQLEEWMVETPIEQFERAFSLNADAYTYFAKGRVTGRIKIGQSRQPERRISCLQSCTNGESADALVILRGRHLERVYHDAFRQWLEGNEWFAPHPSILNEIDRLKALKGEAI